MNLFFDLDGTLTDSSIGMRNCYSHALQSLGFPPPTDERLRLCFGPPLATSFRLLLDSADDELIEEAVALYRARYGSTGLYENEPYPGVTEGLQVLRERGHDLRVVTLKADPFARRILQHFALLPFFDAVHAPELHHRAQSKAELVREAIDAAGATPHESVMIGDRADDIAAAKECGVRSIAVTWGFGSGEELRAAGPDVTVGSIPELIGCLPSCAPL